MKLFYFNSRDFIVVDDDFTELFNNWPGTEKHCFFNSDGYPAMRCKCENQELMILLHRLVMGFPKDFEVDHIYGIKLDCRRESLRICTKKENMAFYYARNRRLTGFPGIYFEKGRYYVRPTVNKRKKRFGSYKKFEDAICAWFGALGQPLEVVEGFVDCRYAS